MKQKALILIPILSIMLLMSEFTWANPNACDDYLARHYKKDIVIELFNEAGQKVMAFFVYECWPSRYSALQELDANNTSVAIESLVLQHSGWERDMAVTEPTEPSFNTP